jgi:SAM-dependent methyltransferase
VQRKFEIAAQPMGVLQTIREAGRRRLPSRYGTDLWDKRFLSRLKDQLRPGIAILDVGAGRRPMLAPADRPSNTHYVGLDLDAEEFAVAGKDSYDETVISAAEERVPALEGRFDLCLSFFAFEHVRSTAAVLENIRNYLCPGGLLLAQLAGSRSPFSVANRILPSWLSEGLLRRTNQRPAESVFPAFYDRCTHSELTSLLATNWTEAEVLPLYTAAGYVLFSRAMTAAYIGYEELIYRHDRRDLAPYYLIAARR